MTSLGSHAPEAAKPDFTTASPKGIWDGALEVVRPVSSPCLDERLPASAMALTACFPTMQ